MRKVVFTEMKDNTVTIKVDVFPENSSPIISEGQVYCFPMDLVNPRIALQIATLLVSDPTVPQCDEKASNQKES